MKIAARFLQLRWNPSFITPISLETTQKKSKKEKEERGGEKETGIPDIFLLNYFKFQFDLETVEEKSHSMFHLNSHLFILFYLLPTLEEKKRKASKYGENGAIFNNQHKSS